MNKIGAKAELGAPKPGSSSRAKAGATFWAAMALAFAGGYMLAGRVLPPFGLHAKYFSNDNWSGPPILQVVDREMSTDVLAERTTDFVYRYTVEWSGYLVVHRPGLYRFTTNSDDGSELAVDDRTVVFNRGIHGLQQAEGLITLTRGIHPIWMQYLQNGGLYALTVEWGRDGDRPTPLTNRSLLADQRTYVGFWLLRLAPAIAGLLTAFGFWFMLTPASWIVERWSRSAVGRVQRRTFAWLERPAVAIGLLVLVGGAARLAMMLGSTGILWPDSYIFYLTAEHVLAGDPLQHDAFRTPAYSYFLAAFLRAGETPMVGSAVVATQHALGLGATLLFYLAGRRAFTPLVALFGALLFSLHSIELFYEASILSEALFVPALALVIFEVVRLRSSRSLGSLVWIGALCALLTLVRPAGLWFGVCVLPALWLSIPTRRRALVAMATVVAVNVALLLPWMAINKREFGFFGIAVGTGVGLYRTAFEIEKLPLPASTRHPELTKIATTARELHWNAHQVRDELDYQLGRSVYRADQELLDFSLEAIAQTPGRFMVGVLRKWLLQLGGSLGGGRTCLSPQYGPYLCSGRMTGMAKPAFPNVPSARWRTLREWLVKYVRFGYVRMWVVLAFALLGAAAYFADARRRNPSGLLMALAIAYITVLPAIIENPEDRYRLPIDALLFMFAAWGVAALGGLMKERGTLMA